MNDQLKRSGTGVRAGLMKGTCQTDMQFILSSLGGSNTHTHTHLYRLLLLGEPGAYPGYSIGVQPGQGTRVQVMQTPPWRESNPGPWRCEANVLTVHPTLTH